MSKYKNTETMKIAEAAKLMHKNPCFIRQGIIDGRLEFGRAVCSNGRWNFYINRNKFFEVTGIQPVEEDEYGKMYLLPTAQPLFNAEKGNRYL